MQRNEERLFLLKLNARMNKICLAEIHNPTVRNFIDQSRVSKISRNHELVNKIKLHKGKFQLQKLCVYELPYSLFFQVKTKNSLFACPFQ